MNCGCEQKEDCRCEPCDKDPARNESVTSQLNNLVLNLFGNVTKTVVKGRVVWTLPCDYANFGIPGYPRNEGEGVLCYILRIFAATFPNFPLVVNPPANDTDFSMLPNQQAPTGNVVFFAPKNNSSIWQISGGQTKWKIIETDTI